MRSAHRQPSRTGAVGRRLAAALLAGAAYLAPSVIEAADSEVKQRCADAYVDTQKLRRAGRLIAAKQRLLACAERRCPAAIAEQCATWLDEVQAQIPTVVVAATGPDGGDATAVRVLVDGAVRAHELDGRPMALDPGTRRLRFVLSGRPPVERSVLIQQGVKGRRIEVDFRAPKPAAAPAASTSASGARALRPPSERAQPIVAYVLGGVGLVALGVGAGFGIAGKSEVADLDESCGSKAPAPYARTCTDDQVAAARGKLIVADVALATGAAAFAVGLTLFLYNRLSEPDDAPAAVSFGLAPGRGGAAGWLGGRF